MHQHQWKRAGLVTVTCWCGASVLVGEMTPYNGPRRLPTNLTPEERAAIVMKWRAGHRAFFESRDRSTTT